MDNDILNFLQNVNYYLVHGQGNIAFVTVEKKVAQEEQRWRRALGVAFNALGVDVPRVNLIEAFGYANGYVYSGWAEIQRDAILIKD